MITYIILFIISLGLSISCPPLILFGTKKHSGYFSLKYFAENKMLLVFLVIGILLGLNNISQSLWYDETLVTLNVLDHSFFRGLAFIFYDIHPPLYRTINLITIFIFGDNEEVIRALSLFSFAISIWLLYELLKTLYSKKGAIVGCSFFVFSPLSIYYAQEARVYSFLVMLFLFIINVLVNKNVTRRFLKFQIFGILLASCHMLGFVVNALIFTSLLFLNFKAYKSLLLSFLCQLIIVLPSWFNVFLFQFSGYVIFRTSSMYHPNYPGELTVVRLLNLPSEYLFNISSVIFSIFFFILITVSITYRYLPSNNMRMQITNLELETAKTGLFGRLSLLSSILFLGLAVVAFFYDFGLFKYLFSRHNDIFLVFHKLLSITSLVFAIFYFIAFIVFKFLKHEHNRNIIVSGEKTFYHLIVLLMLFALAFGIFTIRNYIFFLPLFVITLSGAIMLLNRNKIIIAVSVLILVFNVYNWDLNIKYKNNEFQNVKLIPTGTIKEGPQWHLLFNQINNKINNEDFCVIYSNTWEIENLSKYYNFKFKEAAKTYAELKNKDWKYFCVFNSRLPKNVGKLVLEIPDEYTKTVVRCYKSIKQSKS